MKGKTSQGYLVVRLGRLELRVSLSYLIKEDLINLSTKALQRLLKELLKSLKNKNKRHKVNIGDF